MKRVVLMLALAATVAACGGKDLGALLERKQTCDGGTCPPPPPPPPPTCDPSLPDLTCGVGACAIAVPACVDGAPNQCVPPEGRDERCNDVDDDCDGEVDEGCDDDGDQFCDADMEIEGSPRICAKGGTVLDCDDEDPARNPGRTEICDDDIDNDCNGLADYLDFNGCTHITASFQDADGMVTIEHGTTARIRADLTPPTDELERLWVISRALPDANCSPEDVFFEEPVDSAAATQRQVGIVNDPSKLSCEYTLDLRIGGVLADQLRLKMGNARPRVSAVVGAVFDENVLVVVVAEGTNPYLTATVPEDPDLPVTVRWSGRDAGLLECMAPCEGPQMRFITPPSAGTYELQVEAADSFDGVFRARTLRVVVTPCTWLRSGGTGDGSGPAVAAALGALEAAVTAAAAAGTNVCVAAGGRFDVSQPLTLPASVGVLAAFNGSGAPANTVATLRMIGAARLRLATGHTGLLRKLTIQGGDASPIVEVTDASPTFEGVTITSDSGVQQVGLQIRAANRSVNVGLRSTTVRFTGAPVDATGVRVEGVGVPAIVRVNGGSDVNITGCRGTCRGVHALGHADARLSGRIIDVEAVGAGSRAHGVEFEAAGGEQPTGYVVGYTRITPQTSVDEPADATVAVRLLGTRDVRIASNGVLGPTTQIAGRRFSAALADGEVGSDGTVIRGDSVRLMVEGNRQVAAGLASYAWRNEACDDTQPNATGTEIGPGILLVGTTTSTVRSNGSNSSRDTGVFGAASSTYLGGAARTLPPIVPGLWTVDTRDVRVAHNEVRSGVLVNLPGCGTDTLPVVEAVRDGLGLELQDALPSEGLRLEANGVVTGRRASFDGLPNLDEGPTRLVAFYGRGSALLVNNYLAATRGTDLVGLYARGGAQLTVINDVIEVEAVAPSANREVAKRGLVAEDMGAGLIDLVNTVVLLREDAGLTPNPVALDLPDGAPFGQLDNNLLFVEAAERGQRGAYAVVGGQQYGRDAFQAFVALVGGAANLILPPLYQSHALEHRRSNNRLSDRSPARDAGRAEGAPADDRFGAPRPQGPGVDIGHHEYTP
ncbi:MAG: hypothetical protein H6730_37850 [Deltaproteobacteria bacterium]|nr:hypothetical protein [Deltaproteobacteria bacterium]